MRALGQHTWVIGDGYLPAWSNGPEPEMVSHEAACILNTGDADAEVRLTIFHEDREPVGPYVLHVGARRTLHQRFNDLADPEPVPRGRGYAAVVESDQPVVVWHTRLDSRQAENALAFTAAHPVGG